MTMPRLDLRRTLAVSAIVLAAALPAASAEESDGGAQPRPRDAAQAVQEGSVTQWLEHYQRERGEEWERSKAATSGAARDAGSVTPTSPAPQPPASQR